MTFDPSEDVLQPMFRPHREDPSVVGSLRTRLSQACGELMTPYVHIFSIINHSGL